jgi:vacuolar protein sorting-associated protein 35
MECIIQAFPDDYHLKTLETLLTTCGQLQPQVNIKNILVSLIDRLANYSTRGETIPAEIPVFTIFSKQIRNVVEVMLQFLQILILFSITRVFRLMMYWLFSHRSSIYL